MIAIRIKKQFVITLNLKIEEENDQSSVPIPCFDEAILSIELISSLRISTITFEEPYCLPFQFSLLSNVHNLTFLHQSNLVINIMESIFAVEIQHTTCDVNTVDQ